MGGSRLLRSVFAQAAAVAILAAPTHAEAGEQGTEPIVFAYAAPRTCPSSEQVLEQVAAFTTKWKLAARGTDARRFELRIERHGSAYDGRLVVHEANGDLSRREMDGETCEDTALALAVAVALAIDPSASIGAPPTPPAPVTESPEPTPEPEPAPPSSSPREPTDRPAGRPSPPPRSSSPFLVALGARGEANAAVSGTLAVVDAYLEAEWNRASERLPWLRPALRLGVRHALSRRLVVGLTRAEVDWNAGYLELCPARFALGRPLTIEGCVGSNVGVLSAEARGIPGSTPTRRAWFDYGALVGARWQFHRQLFLEGVVAMWAPVTRDRLRVEPDGVVTEAPRAGISAGFGVGWRF